ncbi:MAG: phosphate ABC transporter permease subunit PstC [Candidatus Methanomethyliaceae archaeon]|nr:phosphate ABC transporter permease subunit PstC [Candidatus Methanomethyliaceae archaeon]MDW7970421.1 phosphate ABC transporter permease subunit PstC [Nitrososphaerota archaeon]
MKNISKIIFLENFFKLILKIATLIIIVIFLLMFYSLFERSMPSLMENGFYILFGSSWDPNIKLFGGAPAILGTIISSAIAIAFAFPISLSIAIFYTEYCPLRVRPIISEIMNLLAAIPSVIYGIWGLWTISPIIKLNFQEPIIASIGFIPLFSGPAYGLSIFLASLILTIMITPIIASISMDIFLKTPILLKEAMFALGATKWEVLRHVVIPFARRGILAATILGLGRALGETMAVTMVIGNSYIWPFQSISLFSPATTITSKIASEFPESVIDLMHNSSLMSLALILLLFSISISFITKFIEKGVKYR